MQGVKYNHSVDYWALGVVIYEMVVGTSPFHGTDEDELLWNVCHQDVHYPRHLSDNVRDLIVLVSVWLLYCYCHHHTNHNSIHSCSSEILMNVLE